jgi:CMP-N-acetylneuraminic acid synthetase
MNIYAIIPARSGSEGVKDKNILEIGGIPLIGHSILFAKKLDVQRIFCSTDSEEYREIAIKYGAEVPFLRSKEAAKSNSMENDILVDMYKSFSMHNIKQPDLIVWLRPTFIFRNLEHVNECIDVLVKNKSYTSARTICETESRLYQIQDNLLIPAFETHGKSMIRRQDLAKKFKVYSTDVFRANIENTDHNFLGDKSYGCITNKICGLDIDDWIDYIIVKSVYEKGLFKYE